MTKNYKPIPASMYKLCFFLCITFFTACSPARNLVYFSDLKDNTDQKTRISNVVEPKIQPNDLLSITVSTISPESNALFNNGPMQPVNTLGTSVSTTGNNNFREGYLVDNAGMINFPVIGQIKLGGLTKEEATKKIVNEVKRQVKGEPIVNLRFLNFKVTVLGEVTRPASITVPTEKINVLEALSMAGDMTQYGKRDNVLIIREKDGARSLSRINLNSKEALNSPYFYLQQNDIIYVEPDKIKALQTGKGNFYFAKILAAASALVLLAYRLNII